uniref:Peptidase A1 domain-containing protein n=1 Tax=Acrobeloides nanus TaxID=290746 RepID=A0A914EQF1_9BILA
MSIGNYSNTKSFQAISDTAFTAIGGPGAVVDIIAKQIGATLDSEYGTYTIDCNAQIPDFIVTIGNYQYSIDSVNSVTSGA